MQKKIIRIFIVLTITFIIVVFFVGLSKDKTYDTKDLVGQKVSEFQIDHFIDNKKISEKDFKRNGFTLINFWASWCAPCRDEHPYLLKLRDEKNLKIIGVNFKDKKSNAQKFLNDLGNPYTEVATDKLGKHSVMFGIYGIPESLLVDKDLIVIKKFVGPILKNDYRLIKNIIEKK
tara:strand:- start:6847 stop:7371 length:525 start_codon:yes stop_codon:yes gene_type:complete